eukprot:1346050-Prymnesium_polylepis.1
MQHGRVHVSTGAWEHAMGRAPLAARDLPTAYNWGDARRWVRAPCVTAVDALSSSCRSGLRYECPNSDKS